MLIKICLGVCVCERERGISSQKRDGAFNWADRTQLWVDRLAVAWHPFPHRAIVPCAVCGHIFHPSISILLPGRRSG